MAQPVTEVDPGLAQPPFPCAAWGDYDGDGDLDVVVAGLGSHDIAFSILYQNTAGSFTDSGIALLGLARASAAWGDFDGDGDLDLAMTGLTTAGIPTTRVLRNDGATFAALAGPFLGVLGGNVAWGDYDGDGDLDLLVTGVTSTVVNVGVAATRLYRNDGGVFTSVAHPFPNCYLGAATWGDYNKDGRLDLVLCGTSENGALSAAIWRNDGGGTFTDAGANLPGTDLGPAAWGDYDNDGDLDLLFGGNSNDGFVTRIYRNDGGAFTNINAGLLGQIWASGGWGDYDNDGDLDLMMMGYDPVAQIPRSILYRNDAGSFVDAGAVFHDLYLGTMSWIDYDNDGDLDLMLAGNSAGLDVLRLYRNNTATPNAVPVAPTGLAANLIGGGVELSWSAASDDHTPPAGLSYNLRVGTTPGGSQIVSPHAAANGYRRLPALGNVQSDRVTRLDHLQPGETYYWSVQSVDAGLRGSPFALEGNFVFELAAVGDPGLATSTTLRAAPNPFIGTTTLHVAGPPATVARVAIVDAEGRRVRTVWTGRMDGHEATLAWDGRDASGREVPTGIYLARAEDAAGATLGRPVRVVKLR